MSDGMAAVVELIDTLSASGEDSVAMRSCGSLVAEARPDPDRTRTPRSATPRPASADPVGRSPEDGIGLEEPRRGSPVRDAGSRILAADARTLARRSPEAGRESPGSDLGSARADAGSRRRKSARFFGRIRDFRTRRRGSGMPRRVSQSRARIREVHESLFEKPGRVLELRRSSEAVFAVTKDT
jgi:hypothetical protein